MEHDAQIIGRHRRAFDEIEFVLAMPASRTCVKIAHAPFRIARHQVRIEQQHCWARCAGHSPCMVHKDKARRPAARIRSAPAINPCVAAHGAMWIMLIDNNRIGAGERPVVLACVERQVAAADSADLRARDARQCSCARSRLGRSAATSDRACLREMDGVFAGAARDLKHGAFRGQNSPQHGQDRIAIARCRRRDSGRLPVLSLSFVPRRPLRPGLRRTHFNHDRATVVPHRCDVSAPVHVMHLRRLSEARSRGKVHASSRTTEQEM